MADTELKTVIKVNAVTAEAVRAMKDLGIAIEGVGKNSEKSGLSVTGMIKGVASGFAVFNQAAEGVGKVFDYMNKAMDVALDKQRQAAMEKLLPVGTVDRFREATEKMISRQEVLRLSVKGMTGDYKINDEQMQTVLKTSIALSQKTGEQADVIADKLLDALAKGVNKLDDYGIELTKTNDRQFDVNAAMSKFKDIIAENPIDEQTKSLTQMKDAMLELAAAVGDVVAALARGAAATFRYGREFGNYIGDWMGRQEADSPALSEGLAADATPFEIQEARKRRRDSTFGYRQGQQALGYVGGLVKEGRRRDQAPYFNAMGEEEYAAQFGVESWGQDDNWGETKLGRWSTNQKLGRKGGAGADPMLAYQRFLAAQNRGAAYEGSLGQSQYAVGQVSPLEVIVMGIGEEGRGLGIFDRAAVGARGDLLGEAETGGLAGYGSRGLNRLRYGGQSFSGGAEGAALDSQRMGGYEAGDPLGSMSRSITKDNVFKGGAFDAGASGAMAGIEAMITGQAAVGKSIANASAQALKAKAVEWGVFALGELAWGIADAAHLAPTAAAHFAAAAKFGVAATAAGLGAAALGALAGGGGGGGGGGSPSGISAGGGYAGAAGSGSKASGGDTIVINMGDGFYGDAEKTAEAVSRAVRQANRQGNRSQFTSTFSG